jgi:hypothetical protein
MPKVGYTAMLLGATGNVGGQILHLLVQSPLCKKVVVVTRRHVAELAHPKVQQVVVNMDKLEEELAPYAKGVDISLAAFGVGKGSAKMADEEVRTIEITYPTAFASAASSFSRDCEARRGAMMYWILIHVTSVLERRPVGLAESQCRSGPRPRVRSHISYHDRINP